MSNFHKYLNYKQKYFELKYGGGIFTSDTYTINEIGSIIIKDVDVLSFIKYNKTFNLLNFINVNNYYIKSILTEIPTNFEIKNKDSIKLENASLSNNDKYINLILTNKQNVLEINKETLSLNYILYNNNIRIKIFTTDGNYNNFYKIAIYKNISRVIYIEIDSRDKIILENDKTNITNYKIININKIIIKNKGLDINITTNNFTFDFLNIKTLINIKSIDSYHELNENFELLDLLNNNDFDYEHSYDSFRDKYLQQICIESNILLKNMYNSVYNLFYINNNDLCNKIKIFGNIYSIIIEKEVIKNTPNLNKICNDENMRIHLLKNIIKRIPARYDYRNEDIQIYNNKTNSFELIKTINSDFNVLFDTGNATRTIIGKNIVDALGLEVQDFLNISPSGIGGEVIYDKLSKIKIKFITENYSLNNEYEINGYIDESGHKDTIIIGQSSTKGLKNFFNDNYCISYDKDKIFNDIFNPKKIKESREYFLILNNLLLEINKEESNYKFIFLLKKKFLIVIKNFSQHISAFDIDENKDLLLDLYKNLVILNNKINDAILRYGLIDIFIELKLLIFNLINKKFYNILISISNKITISYNKNEIDNLTCQFNDILLSHL